MTAVTFRVLGTPVQQSGTRIVPTKRGRRGISTGGKGLAEWRRDISAEAERQALMFGKLDGPVSVDLWFRFAMPQSRPAAMRRFGKAWCTVPPDGDKLTQRGDALKVGGLLADDARIATWSGEKVEVTEGWTGVQIAVTALTPMHEVA